MFLEKSIERARHIEVQLFGDGHGKVIAIGERDCSAQRRNQKSSKNAQHRIYRKRCVRHCSKPQKLGQQVKYRSAGTVEYVYDDASGAFYFLEVNTRLQVEHGVTEQVYGVDLVRWMIDWVPAI